MIGKGKLLTKMERTDSLFTPGFMRRQSEIPKYSVLNKVVFPSISRILKTSMDFKA